MSDADDVSSDWGAAEAAARRLEREEQLDDWSAQASPDAVELCRELYQKRGVESATPTADSVEIVLAPRLEGVPRWIARPIYRAGLTIADVSPVAGRSQLLVEVAEL